MSLLRLQRHQVYLHLPDWTGPPEDPRVFEVHSLLPGLSSTHNYGPRSSLYPCLPQLQGNSNTRNSLILLTETHRISFLLLLTIEAV